jgi:hypothetical protein
MTPDTAHDWRRRERTQNMDIRQPTSQVLTEKSIVDLVDLVDSLPADLRETFHRLFHISATIGEIDPPEHMHRWIERYFGSVESVLRQRVIKVTNRYTFEATLFNELRARRPLEARIPADLADEIAKTAPDPFCEPYLNTPADSFGRVEGQFSLTASNIAKYDGFHGVVIFKDHDPLAFTRETVIDAINVSREWFNRCWQEDPSAVYPFFMWNCLWKSGASIPHGHAQISLTKGLHYGKVERNRSTAEFYRAQNGRDIFEDIYRVHEALGLGREVNGVRVMANITPLKEKETILTAPSVTEDLSSVIYDVLRCMVEDLNVSSFNMVIWEPPLAETSEDWSDVPVMVRIVDRGDPLNRTSDFGAMELYAASVVSSDPFRVAESLWPALRL